MLLPLPHSREGLEQQFSGFSEGLSKFFFGHWLSFHPFSVQCLYRTIFRGILCLLSQLTPTDEQVLSENLASLAMVCSVLLKNVRKLVLEIMIHYAIPHGKHLIGSNFICLHGNDPQNTVQHWVMDRPPQSLDLNITEAVISAENWTKGRKIQRRALRVLQKAWRTNREGYWTKSQKCFEACYNRTDTVFALHTTLHQF